MSNTDFVRASRDGDQFHYYWAARRCLLLLSPTASLKAITIEGPSLSETGTEDPITVGEEKIDVAEYYGSENLKEATLVRYIQVKHSTVRTDEVWQPSELEETIEKFAKRYKAIKEHLDIADLNGKLELRFVSNRPINSDFLAAIHCAAEGISEQYVENVKKLERFTQLNGTELASFCKILILEGNHEGLWDQQNLLFQDTRYYLVDTDTEAPLLLKELVNKKALTASADNPSITKMDVLRALKTDESSLFPAECQVKVPENAIPREQEQELIQEIIRATGIPIIIHAAGGVGKSVFASRICYSLPASSACILYDCFGNGLYRNVSRLRHRHIDALVQIANELSARGLCHPLIPSAHADSSKYMKAFIYRLQQSVDSIRSKDPNALLCIIIDAADNAEMAAVEMGHSHSFVRDLLREELPKEVRLVALCRTHRQDYLDPPPNALRLELKPFNRTETETYLKRFFPDATKQDIDEFHRLSSQNPRIQAMALSQEIELSEMLRSLGPNPTTVDSTIETLLNKAIIKLRDAAGVVEKAQIDKICTGLATLRPFIPMNTLASISGVDESAIRSFAFDLGRPLLVTGDMIQFFDEPAETWFRDKFKPKKEEQVEFIAVLKRIAVESTYVSFVLPQLMFEAGQMDELVSLVLTSEALPIANPIEKRNVELQRLQFALKASLRSKRYTDAVKLTLKAGGETAGDERQRKLLQSNTDLTAVFLGYDSIQDLVSRKTFKSSWTGSRHAYEASLLSVHPELKAEARSRLRITYDWLKSWSRLSKVERGRERISDDDIVEMVIAEFNISGANACASALRWWTPRDVSFRVGRLLARRFIDHNRYDDLNELAVAAGNNIFLVIAIIMELQEVQRTPPKIVLEIASRFVFHPRFRLNNGSSLDYKGTVIRAVTSIVVTACKLAVGNTESLISLLNRFLPASPPRSFSSQFNEERFPLLRAYALRAELSGQSIDLESLAHDDLRKKIKSSYSESEDIREFRLFIGAYLPWCRLWAAALLGKMTIEDILNTVSTLRDEYNRNVYSYHKINVINNEIASIYLDILLHTDGLKNTVFDEWDQWIKSCKNTLYTSTLIRIARIAARSNILQPQSLNYAHEAFQIVQDAREDAETQSDTFIALSRAVLAVSRTEAEVYFNEAVKVASKIGDENLDRWMAQLDLADRAASSKKHEPLLAYRLARCAELTYKYVARDKYFDWRSTIQAIAGLCPSSVFAILSRWRDRNFGDADRLLPFAIEYLIQRGELHPNTALALTPIRAEWDKVSILRKVLSTSENEALRITYVKFIYRYMILDEQTSKTWREFKCLLEEYGMSLPDLDNQIAFCEHKEGTYKPYISNHISESVDVHEQKCDWDIVFSDIDLCNSNDISRAYSKFRSSGPPYNWDLFFAEAFSRVEIGKAAEFIKAIAIVNDFSLYQLSSFIEHFPTNWHVQLSVKHALAETIKSFYRRFCMDVTRSRGYEGFPLKTACEISGISEDNVNDVILSSIGDSTEIIRTERLFSLVGILSTKLNIEEAKEALTFGLNLFDSTLEDDDGDGPWSSRFEPPSNIDEAVSGYIWGCLASPVASLRWEAAHVVRAVCTLNIVQVLDHLINLGNGLPVEAFYDNRLFFYKLHARQWLLIGLAHAAIDNPVLLVPYSNFLINIVLSSEPHVLIQEFAKRALLSLLKAGNLHLDHDLHVRLTEVNTSLFPAVESNKYLYHESEDTEEMDDDENGGYYYGCDIGPYWFAPLGRCFVKSGVNIQREVTHVIKNDWGIKKGLRWDNDERNKRNIFEDMQTSCSHGSYPRVDNLQFYLCYHAMMVVAGKLLASTPVHQDMDFNENNFIMWLRQHSIACLGGGWLADCRDPLPYDWPTWKDEKETEDWLNVIENNTFDETLGITNDYINLWGCWEYFSGHQKERVHVSSATVTPHRSLSLLRAFQSVENHHDYRLPNANNDNFEIDIDGFLMKGWIVDRTKEYGIDRQDPWAGDILYPPPEPADYIIDVMKLVTDDEHRHWSIAGNDKEVARSQVWGHFNESERRNERYESGQRFQASNKFLFELLYTLKLDLIVEIEIDRSIHYDRWERGKEYDVEYGEPRTRLYLIRSSGEIITL